MFGEMADALLFVSQRMPRRLAAQGHGFRDPQARARPACASWGVKRPKLPDQPVLVAVY
jgi:hypothetical protein